jgi:hypothetical protein
MPIRPRLVTRLLVGLDAAVLAGALATWGAQAWSSSPARAAANLPGSSTTMGGTSATSAPATSELPPLPPLLTLPPTTANQMPASTAVVPPTTAAPDIVPNAGQASMPGPVTPTPPGTYVYSASGQSGRGSSTTTLNEKVVTQSNATGEVRQSVTDTSSDGSGTTRQEVSWRSTGLYLRSMDLGFGGSGASCTFVTPVQLLALPLAVGKQWPIDGTCTVTFNGAQDTVKLHGSGKVSGIERVAVGGQPVDVWVVDASFDITGTGAFAFNSHETVTRRLTAQGVVVTDKSTTTNVPFAGTISEERQLRSLKPS